MPTVADLVKRVRDISNKFVAHTSNISDAYDSLIHTVDTSSKVSKYKVDASKYDRLFQEEEAKLQARGGRSRHQTLQEFVLLFFYVSFGVLIVALALTAKVQGSMTDAVKIIGLMLLILMVVSGIIIRYA